MGSEEEEASLRLGLDHRPFAGGIRETKAMMQDLSEHGHSGFLHIESGGKAFHHVLKDITDQSPLLGTAMRLAINPISGALMGAALAFKYFNDQIKEANSEMEKMETAASRGVGNMAESFSKANEEGLKLRREFKQFNEKTENTGDTEEDRLKRHVDALKEKYGEDKAGFLAAKTALLAQQSEMSRVTAEYEKQRAAGLEMQASDRDRLAKIQDIKEQLKQSDEHIKELQKEKPVNKAGLEIRTSADIMGDLMAEQHRRNVLEEQSLKLTEKQLDIKDQLKEAEASTIKHLEQASKLENERAATVAEAADNKRRMDREAFDEDERQWYEMKRQDEERVKLLREIHLAQEEERDAKLDPYRPTLQAIANSAAWNPGDVMSDQFQRQMDRSAMGTGFEAQHAEQAQRLLMAEDDAKRAFAIEGPESVRFKNDQTQITSLKKALQDAGLMKSESKLDSLDNHMASLLEMAQKEGLKMQPVMGK